MDFRNHCKKCPASVHCCIFRGNRGFTFVGISDAKKIKRTTGKDFDDFLTYSPLPRKVVGWLTHGDPSLEASLRYSQLDKNRILRLKTVAGRCIFYNGKCRIYSCRPNICRIYPFWAVRLISGKLKTIDHCDIPRCRVVKAMSKHGDDVEKSLTKKQIEEIKKIFRRIQKEKIEYRKNVKRFVKGNLR